MVLVVNWWIICGTYLDDVLGLLSSCSMEVLDLVKESIVKGGKSLKDLAPLAINYIVEALVNKAVEVSVVLKRYFSWLWPLFPIHLIQFIFLPFCDGRFSFDDKQLELEIFSITFESLVSHAKLRLPPWKLCRTWDRWKESRQRTGWLINLFPPGIRPMFPGYCAH